MDIIRRYIPDINDFDDRHKACEQIIKEFMKNYTSIVYESESQFICKYFMSAVLAFCADINFKEKELLEKFLRFFIEHQSGIWDIWSVHQFEPKQWTTVQNCLGIELTNISDKSGSFALKYIIEWAHNLNIDFIDPNDPSIRIRFIDYPRFDSIESKSELWRNLHLPVIDCTLLPEDPLFLRLLLQFGARIPALDHQIPHFTQRVRHSMTTTLSIERYIKKLFWIQLICNEVSHTIKFFKELSLLGNNIIEIMRKQLQYNRNHSLFDTIPRIPKLKQIVRQSIRQKFRSEHKLPQSLSNLEIHPILKDYLNLIYL